MIASISFSGIIGIATETCGFVVFDNRRTDTKRPAERISATEKPAFVGAEPHVSVAGNVKVRAR